MLDIMVTGLEKDHYLEPFFLKLVPYNLLPIIENMARLMCKSDSAINPREMQVIPSCVINWNVTKTSTCVQNFTGRMLFKLGYSTNRKIQISAGALVTKINLQHNIYSLYVPWFKKY